MFFERKVFRHHQPNEQRCPTGSKQAGYKHDREGRRNCATIVRCTRRLICVLSYPEIVEFCRILDPSGSVRDFSWLGAWVASVRHDGHAWR